MTRRLYYIVLFILMLSILSTGCRKESTVVDIDPVLLPYFERFRQEGATRGVEVSPWDDQIQGVFSNIDMEGVIGQCSHNSSRPNLVLISESYWAEATELQKEFLVFHELGHCYLSRGHIDTSSRGRCVSIMHSSDMVCRLNYNSETRSSYIDELFNP